MNDLPPLRRYFEAHRDEMGSPYLQTLLNSILNEIERVPKPADHWTTGFCAGCGGEIRLVAGGNVPVWHCDVCG